MLEQLKANTKFWNEFVEWMKVQGYYLDKDGDFMEDSYGADLDRLVVDRELTSLLVEFLDSKGYIISPQLGSKWWYYIQDVNEAVEYDSPDLLYWDSRQLATESGILKAAELYEREVKG